MVQHDKRHVHSIAARQVPIEAKPVDSTAAMYVEAGLSVIPIRANGTKRPAVRAWKEYQSRQPTHDEVKSWFAGASRIGVAIIAGSVSGGLEVIDIDEGTLVEPWTHLVDEIMPGLLARLPRVRTPSGGAHIYYRTVEIEGSQKLAERCKDDPLATTKRTLIETRGEGGYVLAPGSHPECHPLGKAYEHVAGPAITEVPIIKPEERDTMLDLARSFNQNVKVVTDAQAKKMAPGGDQRPGNEFNHTASWPEVLEPHDWRKVGESGNTVYWRRPGKDHGCSATTGHCTNGKSGDLLYVFSSNAPPFEPNRPYSKFHAYALLNHNGKLAAASRTLSGEGPEIQNQVKRIVESLEHTQGVSLFADPDGEAYATVPLGDSSCSASPRCETYRIRSTLFASWLLEYSYRKHGIALSGMTKSTLIGQLEARAKFGDGPAIEVFTRIGMTGDKSEIWIDLANETNQYIRIGADGWSLELTSPLKFVRLRGQRSLPCPVHQGSARTVRRMFAMTEDMFVLVISWLVAALRPIGPYPILILHGEQGSAKSTLAHFLLSLVDPQVAPLRAPPKDVRDLMIAANNNYVLCFDNWSDIPPWMSDALCRLATGGGYGTRELYTNSEEVLFNLQRPVMLNGIVELVAGSDLLDRSLLIELSPIPQQKRRAESELWRELTRARPRILGALLDAISTAIAEHPNLIFATLPRMADFASWVCAAEKKLPWSQGGFSRAYETNQVTAATLALQESGFVGPLLRVTENGWRGTAEQLLGAMRQATPKLEWSGLPGSARALSSKLRRMVPNLPMAGRDVKFRRGGGKANPRIIQITNTRGLASASSEKAATRRKSKRTKGSAKRQS